MRRVLPTVALLALLLTCSGGGVAEERVGESLTAGVVDAPPFTSLNDAGTWEGLSIELWQRILDDLGVQGSLRGYSDFTQLRQALLAGEIDVLLTVPATQENETILDLSQPYFRSGYGIAVAAGDSAGGLLAYLAAVDFSELALLSAGLGGLWLLTGTALYLLERRRNAEMFGGGLLKGAGQGMWWAAVTMTTVGYGDKAPLTLAGRLLAVVWMLASIILISSFTASIAASLTSEQLRGSVRGPGDLPHVRVGSIGNTQPFDWLTDHGIAAASFESVDAGLTAISLGEIDAFVFDVAVLRSTASSDYPGKVSVLPQTVAHYYLGMAVPNGFELRESIDRSLLGTIASDDWARLLARYGLRVE